MVCHLRKLFANGSLDRLGIIGVELMRASDGVLVKYSFDVENDVWSGQGKNPFRGWNRKECGKVEEEKGGARMPAENETGAENPRPFRSPDCT